MGRGRMARGRQRMRGSGGEDEWEEEWKGDKSMSRSMSGKRGRGRVGAGGKMLVYRYGAMNLVYSYIPTTNHHPGRSINTNTASQTPSL